MLVDVESDTVVGHDDEVAAGDVIVTVESNHYLCVVSVSGFNLRNQRL